jgi:hypothetical protein
METELAYGDLILRLDGAVIEVLSTSRTETLRIHANHLCVNLTPTKKGDQLEVRIGTRRTGEPQGPIVVTDDKVSAPRGPFKVALAEEPRLQELFAEAERRRVPFLGPVDY